jgi:hypothetical protein
MLLCLVRCALRPRRHCRAQVKEKGTLDSAATTLAARSGTDGYLLWHTQGKEKKSLNLSNERKKERKKDVIRTQKCESCVTPGAEPQVQRIQRQGTM